MEDAELINDVEICISLVLYVALKMLTRISRNEYLEYINSVYQHHSTQCHFFAPLQESDYFGNLKNLNINHSLPLDNGHNVLKGGYSVEPLIKRGGGV